jgi:hypothetical protein
MKSEVRDGCRASGAAETKSERFCERVNAAGDLVIGEVNQTAAIQHKAVVGADFAARPHGGTLMLSTTKTKSNCVNSAHVIVTGLPSSVTCIP